MALSTFARVLSGDSAVEENNRLISEGKAKANSALFGVDKVVTRDVGGGFRGAQYGPGGVEVISRGYGGTNPALQAIQSLRDAGLTPEQATAATTGASVANVNETRATLLPAESEADIAVRRAQALLNVENARQVAPLARAEIGLRGAQSRSTNIQSDIAAREGLMLQPGIGSSLLGVMGKRGSLYRLSDDGDVELLGPDVFRPRR